MKHSPKEFSDALPAWKRRKDPPLTKVFYRPVSFVLAALFSEIGFSANAVSYLSAVIGLAGCAFFIAGMPVVGAILINCWGLLDSTDGNIARCVKQEKFGDFADSMSSYITQGLVMVSLGFCVFKTGGVLLTSGNEYAILLGALGGSSDSLARLIYQNYLNSLYAQGEEVRRARDPEQESGLTRLRMRVDANFTIGGIFPAVMLLGAIFSFLDIVLVIWSVFFIGALVASSLYLVHKTVEANRVQD